MNICAFTGRLVRNPESKETQSGTTLTRYTIAVRRDYTVEGQPDADFIPVLTFGRAAEWAINWLTKGTKVEVVGKLQLTPYEDNEGTKRTSIVLIADKQEFAESKKASQENAQPQQEEAPKPAPKPKRRPAPPIPTGTQEPLLPDDDFQQISSDEDLPF